MFTQFLMFPFHLFKSICSFIKKNPLALFFKTNPLIILFWTRFWFIRYSLKTYYSVFISFLLFIKT